LSVEEFARAITHAIVPDEPEDWGEEIGSIEKRIILLSEYRI
jgi:hypothetical protein